MIKQKGKLYLLLCFLSLLGVLIMLYPYFQQGRYTQKVEQSIQAFEEVKNQGDPEIYSDLYDEMAAYNKGLYKTRQEKLTNVAAYEELDFSLQARGFESEMFGYISIPVINIDLPIYLGATKSNMNLGAVRLSQTSLPVGGENTNTVIAAHRGMATAAMFRDIEKISLGDAIYVTNLFETLEYKVVDLQVISPNNLNAVLIQEGKDMITLVTCHPYRSNYQRYVVYCERVA